MLEAAFDNDLVKVEQLIPARLTVQHKVVIIIYFLFQFPDTFIGVLTLRAVRPSFTIFASKRKKVKHLSKNFGTVIEGFEAGNGGSPCSLARRLNLPK